MGKFFKLGKKASSFVDTTTKKKIAPGQTVEFEKADMKTKRFKSALLNGHIVNAKDEDLDDDDDLETTLTEDQAAFRKQNKESKIKYLLDTYELDEDEIKSIKLMKADELNAEYDRLEALDSEEE